MENTINEPTLTSDEKSMAMLCHLLGLFIGFLGPLIIWLTKKNESSFIDYHGKEAINFAITVTILAFASAILCFVFIGFVLLPIVAIGNLVFLIIASVKANQGEYYKYPINFRFIK